MNLWTNLRNFFRSEPPPPRLRNKPGGLAWVCTSEKGGVETLYGAIVRTVSVNERGYWSIEPDLTFVTTRAVRMVANGNCYPRGTTIVVMGMSDASLQPIKNPGDEERSQEAYFQPKVPAFAPRKVKA